MLIEEILEEENKILRQRVSDYTGGILILASTCGVLFVCLLLKIIGVW